MKRLIWLLPLLVSLCLSLAACVGPENDTPGDTAESPVEDGGRI